MPQYKEYLIKHVNAIFKRYEDILGAYNQLNDLGQQEAIKRVKELTYLPDYKK